MPNKFRLLGFLFILLMSSCHTIEPPKEKEIAEFIKMIGTKQQLKQTSNPILE